MPNRRAQTPGLLLTLASALVLLVGLCTNAALANQSSAELAPSLGIECQPDTPFNSNSAGDDRQPDRDSSAELPDIGKRRRAAIDDLMLAATEQNVAVADDASTPIHATFHAMFNRATCAPTDWPEVAHETTPTARLNVYRGRAPPSISLI